MLYQSFAKKRPREFVTPDDFLMEAAKYFEWCDDHPLLEEKLFQFKGSVVRAKKGKVRSYTKTGLTLFLGIPSNRFKTYTDRGGEWADAVQRIEDAIYEQKFVNAAANLLNPGMMQRDLGLADKQEVKNETLTVHFHGPDIDL